MDQIKIYLQIKYPNSYLNLLNNNFFQKVRENAKNWFAVRRSHFGHTYMIIPNLNFLLY